MTTRSAGCNLLAARSAICLARSDCHGRRDDSPPRLMGAPPRASACSWPRAGRVRRADGTGRALPGEHDVPAPDSGRARDRVGIGERSAARQQLLRGILAQDLSWRWTMFVNLGSAGAIAVGAAALQEYTARQPIDVPDGPVPRRRPAPLSVQLLRPGTAAGDPPQRSRSSGRLRACRPRSRSHGAVRCECVSSTRGRSSPSGSSAWACSCSRPTTCKRSRATGRTGLAFPLAVIAATIANTRLAPDRWPESRATMAVSSSASMQATPRTYSPRCSVLAGRGSGLLYAPRDHRHPRRRPQTRMVNATNRDEVARPRAPGRRLCRRHPTVTAAVHGYAEDRVRSVSPPALT